MRSNYIYTIYWNCFVVCKKEEKQKVTFEYTGTGFENDQPEHQLQRLRDVVVKDGKAITVSK
jgi:hypothetical protein